MVHVALRCAGTLALNTFCAPLWPAFKWVAVLCHKRSPVARMVPGPALALVGPFSGPVVNLVILAWMMRTVFPDKWRSLRVWRRILPIFSWYMWTKYTCNLGRWLRVMSEQAIQKRWNRRHEWGGSQVYGMIRDVNGYYVKSGQVMANERHVLPDPWCRQLASLWDNVKPRPWKGVKRSLEKDLRSCTLTTALSSSGGSEQPQQKADLLARVFSRVDTTPLASASIAQVHRAALSSEALAALKDEWTHGPEVVLKVQHSDVQSMMAADLRNMASIARFLAHLLPFDPVPIVDEIQVVIPKEFNFAREARLTSAIAANLSSAGLDDHVVVPGVVHALCAPGLITLQYMEGIPLTKAMAAASTDSVMRERAAAGLKNIIRVWGAMMLGDGIFHADPHPGNYFLREDGRVALLDFGQVKVVSVAQQQQLAALVVALADGDALQAAMAAGKLGVRFGGQATNPDIAAVLKMLYIMFDTRQMAELEQYDFGGGAVVSGAPLELVPGSLFLICRGCLMLRGMCQAVNADISAVTIWRDIAEATLSKDQASLESRHARNTVLDQDI